MNALHRNRKKHIFEKCFIAPSIDVAVATVSLIFMYSTAETDGLFIDQLIDRAENWLWNNYEFNIMNEQWMEWMKKKIVLRSFEETSSEIYFLHCNNDVVRTTIDQ